MSRKVGWEVSTISLNCHWPWGDGKTCFLLFPAWKEELLSVSSVFPQPGTGQLLSNNWQSKWTDEQSQSFCHLPCGCHRAAAQEGCGWIVEWDLLFGGHTRVFVLSYIPPLLRQGLTKVLSCLAEFKLAVLLPQPLRVQGLQAGTITVKNKWGCDYKAFECLT